MEKSFIKEKGRCDQGPPEDAISKLPDSLITQLLFYLPTKEAVRTSVLSHRWKTLWLWITPHLDLNSSQFPNYNEFVSFMNKFLDFSREENSCLHKLKLIIDKDEENDDESCVTRLIGFMATRKITHLDVEYLFEFNSLVLKPECLEVIPLDLFICQTLIHLRLHCVSISNIQSVSLPCLKTMRLESNLYANEESLETLISSCSILEDLRIVRRAADNVKVLRVRSHTLISLKVEVDLGDPEVLEFDINDSGVVVDAPRLKYLNFEDDVAASKIITNSGSLTKVNISQFHLKGSTDMVRGFFTSISGVRDLKICYGSYEVIESFKPFPQFRNLSCLKAETYFDDMNSLLNLLESCPNLKSLILELLCCSLREQITSPVPRCLLSSLEFVEIKRIFDADTTDSEVARYFLENSAILKKLVLRRRSSTIEEDSVALRHLLALPRRSSLCQIVIC